MKSGLLVVKRFPIETSYYTIINRKPSIMYSHEKIAFDYKGIDGIPWPSSNIQLIEGLASTDQYNEVISYYKLIKEEYLSDLLLIKVLPFEVQINEPCNIVNNFTFIGYDYGNYISEFNCYSSIYHEVIYGFHKDMRQYSSFFNKHLLLPNIEKVGELARTRQILLEKGTDGIETVEEGEEFAPIAIFIHQNTITHEVFQ